METTQIGNANPAISGDISKKGENIRVKFNTNGKIEIFDNAEMTGTPVIALQIDNTSITVSEFYFFRDGIKIKDANNNYLTVVSFPYTNASNVPPTIVGYGVNGNPYLKISANTILKAGDMLQFQQGVNEYYSLGCALNPYNVPDDNCLKLFKTITNYIYGAGYVIWKTTQIGNANPAISGDISKKEKILELNLILMVKFEIFDNAEMTGTPVIAFTN